MEHAAPGHGAGRDREGVRRHAPVLEPVRGVPAQDRRAGVHRVALGEAAEIDAHAFDAVRFRGPGTDLTIGLIPDGRWMCATNDTVTGIEHIPNLPTEEVYTSPDWRRTEGVVRSTMPLIAVGTRVDDLEVRFEQGKIVEVKASAGQGIIEQQIAMDEQAAFLGEVALVDGSSAVKETGLIFHDTLFDENATCHIAFGAGFPYALEGDGKLAIEYRATTDAPATKTTTARRGLGRRALAREVVCTICTL